MKQLLILLLLCPGAAAFAQGSGEQNPSYNNPANKHFFDEVLTTAVLSGTTQAEAISVNENEICFDKVIKIKSTFPGTTAGACLFINTKIGLIANTPVKAGSGGDCNINPLKDDFILFIVGLKGNTFNYFNAKKNRVVEHYVSTGNSETYLHQFTHGTEVVRLFKTPNVKTYLGGKIKAWEYKADGREERWWLFGKTVPDKIDMAPNKFLGNYAVGFQYTAQGMFIIMEVTSPAYSSEITELEDRRACFNPGPFKFLEDANFTAGIGSINRRREKINKKLANLSSTQCPALHAQKLDFQLKALEREEQTMIIARQGNVQQSVQVQAATLHLPNYDDSIQEAIYDTEISICGLQQEREQSKYFDESRQAKLACLINQRAEQIRAQQDFALLHRQYAGQPSVEWVKKQKILLDLSLKACK